MGSQMEKFGWGRNVFQGSSDVYIFIDVCLCMYVYIYASLLITEIYKHTVHTHAHMSIHCPFGKCSLVTRYSLLPLTPVEGQDSSSQGN